MNNFPGTDGYFGHSAVRSVGTSSPNRSWSQPSEPSDDAQPRAGGAEPLGLHPVAREIRLLLSKNLGTGQNPGT